MFGQTRDVDSLTLQSNKLSYKKKSTLISFVHKSSSVIKHMAMVNSMLMKNSNGKKKFNEPGEKRLS